jgi:hypothetical protein
VKACQVLVFIFEIFQRLNFLMNSDKVCVVAKQLHYPVFLNPHRPAGTSPKSDAKIFVDI